MKRICLYQAILKRMTKQNFQKQKDNYNKTCLQFQKGKKKIDENSGKHSRQTFTPYVI